MSANHPEQSGASCGTVTATGNPSAEPAAAEPRHEAFYSGLTVRNEGLIPPLTQQRLRRATVLIAGCGSVGGSVIELLARMGVEQFILADPETFELSNGNRQHACVEDIGRNKAACFARNVHAINPFAKVRVEELGISRANVAALVEAAAIVVDGVEVAVNSAREAKCRLHLEAFHRRRPVVAGADVAGTAMVRCYDYRRPDARYYNGLISEDEIGRLSMTQFMTRDIPLRVQPLEMFAEIERLLAGKPHFSQLGPTAQMLGALMAQAVMDLLEGKCVRALVKVDLPTVFRTKPRGMAATCARTVAMFRCLRLYFKVRKCGESALPGWAVGRQEADPELHTVNA